MKTMKMSKKKEDQIISTMEKSMWDLPSPSSMSYFWNFGSMLGICLIIQILTGLTLSLHYTSFAPESFSSIVTMMQEVWYGWIIRFSHMNGASMFFIFMYLHLFRGMMFMSATHKKVWMSGVTIMITLMAISFLGYVLPWGQMSYWAVAVITNLFSVIPIIGSEVVKYMWGGFSVSEPTLTRFYSIHFLLPFVMSLMVMIHLTYLHKEGSSNSVGTNSNLDKIQFHPYFSVKDVSFMLSTIALMMMVIMTSPYMMGDPVNNIPANPMQTPLHIQPEWYFLTSYTILRSMPSKSSGVIALLLSVAIFYVIPMFEMKFSTNFNKTRMLMFWSMTASFLYLMKLGTMPAEEPFVSMGKMGTMIYFTTIMMLNI